MLSVSQQFIRINFFRSTPKVGNIRENGLVAQFDAGCVKAWFAFDVVFDS